MTIKKILVGTGILLGIASVAIIFAFIGVNKSEQAIKDAQANRTESLLLAEELRESSRKLTAAVQKFVVTGDESYANEYMDTVLVRDGAISRPTDSAIAPGRAVALTELMLEADYTEHELYLLLQSEELSNSLITLETEAMNAVRGLYPDGEGNYTVVGVPDKTKAQALIFSADYDAEVAMIMEPFAIFKQELDLRLNNTISVARARYSQMILFVWIILGAVITIFGAFLLLAAVVILRPVLLCDKFAKQVAKGNFSSPLRYASSNEIGSLAVSLRSMLQSLLDRSGLQEQIRYYSAVISSVDAGIIIKDKHGLITDWNTGAESILGYMFDEIIGKSSTYYAPDEEHDKIYEIQNQLEKGKHTTHVEVVRRHKDGQLIDCSASYTPIFDNSGEFEGSVAIFHDITEKKLAEQRAHKLAAIIAIADAGIIVKDKDGIVLEWNIGAENILGYKPGEIVGHTTKYYAPEKSHADIDKIEHKLRNGEHTAHAEVVRKHKDGRLIDCSASYTPIFDNKGIFEGSVAIFHDVTAERQAEKKAKKLSDIIKMADAGIVVKDVDCIVQEWNIGAENILGYKPDEIIGKHTKYYVPEDAHSEVDEIKERLIKGEHTAHIEVVRRHKDGRLIDCSATYTPLFDDNGEFFGSLAVFQDISEKKQIERALQEAVRVAEEASKAKSTFLANMSHEIRTPMNGVVGFAELALDDIGISGSVRACLTKIKTSADSLLSLINDILDLSKVEAGAMELEKIPFDLHEIFEDCEIISKSKAEEKGVALHLYSEPFIGRNILGDPTKLRQVLVNLLSNAIKFTNHGIVKLTAVLEEQKDDTVAIRFEVRDSGIGMTQEQIGRIFEPFVQADGSTTRKYGGTGLGLTITKSFVEMMGGELSVESTPELGSKFSFMLTFGTIAEQKKASLECEPSHYVQKPKFKGEVLVCEDNPINQELITKHLSRIGLSVIIAENGKQGVEAAEERIRQGRPFDLILMDIQMPVMDGLEATGKLLDIGSQSPIIALTANAMRTDKEKYLKQGMSDYLSKPFNTKDLWACLARNLTPVVAPCNMALATESEPAQAGGGQPLNAVLNEASGIEQSVGDEQFYRHIQKKFYEDNQKVVAKLKKAIRVGDAELAYRTAHTLKSQAALIGAEQLSKAAHELELTLSDMEASCSPWQIDALESSLIDVFTVLEPLMPEQKHKPEQAVKTLNKGEADRLINRLSPLLEAGNPECVELSAEVKTVLSSFGDLCDTLAVQMEDYDFDKAFDTMREIKEQLENI